MRVLNGTRRCERRALGVSRSECDRRNSREAAGTPRSSAPRVAATAADGEALAKWNGVDILAYAARDKGGTVNCFQAAFQAGRWASGRSRSSQRSQRLRPMIVR